MKEIDARGLNCPAPVLKLKTLIESERPEAIKIIVDNDAAKQNVCRFFESQQYSTEFSMEGDDFHVFGTSGTACDTVFSETSAPQTETKKIMVMAATDRMGFGDDVLGKKLMLNFIKTLKEMGPDLWRLVLVNNGVKLAISGSDALPDLKSLVL